MDGARDYNSQQTKSVRERAVPCDFTDRCHWRSETHEQSEGDGDGPRQKEREERERGRERERDPGRKKVCYQAKDSLTTEKKPMIPAVDGGVCGGG